MSREGRRNGRGGTRRTSFLLTSLGVFSGGCAPGDAAETLRTVASTPPAPSVAVSGGEQAPSASSITSALRQASADACQSDADCVLLAEDECCVPTTCDQDRQALSRARAEEKHLQCARMDCYVPARKDCSVADVRVVAACRQGRCVLLEPTGRVREPRPAK